jgi:hypothetical protein
MYTPKGLILLSLVVVAGAAAAQEDTDADQSLYTPSRPEGPLLHNPFWYLPREASLGMFVATDGVLVPQLRLKWEWSLYHSDKDTLYAGAEGGGGYGFNLPEGYDAANNPPMTFFYEHLVLALLGYRIDTSGGFYFALEAGGGMLFYGGRSHLTGGGSGKEGYTVGTFEGRAKVGLRAGKTVMGVYIADDVPFGRPAGSAYYGYVGGLLVGLFVNWH